MRSDLNINKWLSCKFLVANMVINTLQFYFAVLTNHIFLRQ